MYEQNGCQVTREANMPWAPKRPCSYPGCPELTDGGLCEKHKRLLQHEQNQARGGSAKMGYGYRWQKARELFLRENPLCAECQRYGRITPATVVDHIKPHKGNQKLFWDWSNWQALCKQCHDKKTAQQDGRWGGAVQIPTYEKA